MYGMKMDDGHGVEREATVGEKIILAPFVGIIGGMCWLIAKSAEAEIKRRNIK